MKKLLVVLALVSAWVGVQAQVYLGGTIGLDVVNVHGYEDDFGEGSSSTQTSFGFAPEVGYNFNDSWAIGAQIGFGISSTDGISLNTYKIMPYVRNTFARAGIVDFFGELGLGYAHQTSTGIGVSGFVSAVRPGMAINFSKKFAVIARTDLLRYEHWDGIGAFEFALNKSFDLGVQFTF